MAKTLKKQEKYEKDKRNYEEWKNTFSDMTEKQAIKHIRDNVYRVKVTKGLISAYLSKFHTDDVEWLKDCVERKQKYRWTNEVINGMTIYNKKTNKPKRIKVMLDEYGEPKFNLNIARQKFFDRYGIEPKPTKFQAKQKIETFNPFEDLGMDFRTEEEKTS